jgi:hypothetical protein
MPEGATEIALVNASSDSGWTKQESVDYAIQELKKQAAKVGANVVVIKVARTETDIVGIPSYGGASSGGYIVPSEKEVIEGIAVYVEH